MLLGQFLVGLPCNYLSRLKLIYANKRGPDPPPIGGPFQYHIRLKIFRSHKVSNAWEPIFLKRYEHLSSNLEGSRLCEVFWYNTSSKIEWAPGDMIDYPSNTSEVIETMLSIGYPWLGIPGFNTDSMTRT